jgi:hypothetical protein
VLRKLFATPYFVVSLLNDVPGAEMCGTLKNIVALAAGMVDGLGLGPNSKATIMRQVRCAAASAGRCMRRAATHAPAGTSRCMRRSCSQPDTSASVGDVRADRCSHAALVPCHVCVCVCLTHLRTQGLEEMMRFSKALYPT